MSNAQERFQKLLNNPANNVLRDMCQDEQFAKIMLERMIRGEEKEISNSRLSPALLYNLKEFVNPALELNVTQMLGYTFFKGYLAATCPELVDPVEITRRCDHFNRLLPVLRQHFVISEELYQLLQLK